MHPSVCNAFLKFWISIMTVTFIHRASPMEQILTDLRLAQTQTNFSGNDPFLAGMSFQYLSSKKKILYGKNATPFIPEKMPVKMTIYGYLPPGTKFKISSHPSCNNTATDFTKVIEVTPHVSGRMGEVRFNTPSIGHAFQHYDRPAYLCLGINPDTMELQGRIGNGSEVYSWAKIAISRSIIAEWFMWICVGFLLFLSGLLSGLNLGIISIDKMDLKIMINTGTSAQKYHARKIRPIRAHGNLFLCCLLFSNVLINSTVTLLMDELTDGITALITSTLAIVMVGEILPQAFCSRFGLEVGGYTIMVTRFFMIISFPLAFPLSKLLDRVLGQEIGVGFTRERLKEIAKAVKDEHLLANEELDVIAGALELKQKTVKEIMRRIEDVYMLPVDGKMDFNTMIHIEAKGFSRIPVYDGELTNVVGILHLKQLIMVDYKEEIAVHDLINLDYYRDNLFCVFENTPLDFMLRKFRQGDRGHMAFVDRINDEGPGDPFYERIGVVTMEDVLEELLQQDIMDESDVMWLSNNAFQPQQ